MNLSAVPEVLDIQTIFDTDVDLPPTLMARGGIKNILLRLLPPDFYYSCEEEGGYAHLSGYLPVVKWIEWGSSLKKMSIYLICLQRAHVPKFFYEMISRWLIPGKCLSISSFYTTDFTFSEDVKHLFTICEIAFNLEGQSDLEQAHRQMSLLESELRLGVGSLYHANRILEIKGLTTDEKTALIQERISLLLRRQMRDFDYGIFTQMQHFLVTNTQEYKSAREYKHQCRIISIFYHFQHLLLNAIEGSPAQRYVYFKVARTRLHLPLGIKKVLSFFLGLNFQGGNELFDERNFEELLQIHFPHLKVIPESCYSWTSQRERIQILYLEVEKSDLSSFSLEEIRELKERMPEEVKSGIEKVARPLFMPRNEEEVMRNMILLSKQLKYFRDLPQAILSFDGQLESELEFTVIWVRVLKTGELPIEELLRDKLKVFQFHLDRVKQIGVLRKKYPKEATVFCVKIPLKLFLRRDRSVDLFKARQALVVELERSLGEFRDYNGGMIAKQHEQFVALRDLLPDLDRKREVLLESFFHSIYPIEFRCVYPLEVLKKLFLLLLEVVQKNRDERCINRTRYCEDEEGCYFLFSTGSSVEKEAFLARVNQFQLSSSELLTLSLIAYDTVFAGVVYREADPVKREKFRLDFCSQTDHNMV